MFNSDSLNPGSSRVKWGPVRAYLYQMLGKDAPIGPSISQVLESLRSDLEEELEDYPYKYSEGKTLQALKKITLSDDTYFEFFKVNNFIELSEHGKVKPLLYPFIQMFG